MLKRKKSKNVSKKFLPNTKKKSVKSIFDIFDIYETELAQQLTLDAYGKMLKIEKSEFLNRNWERNNSDTSAPNLTILTKRHNDLYFWITEEILSYDRKRHRAQAIEKFINVAEECLKINNLNDCFTIIVTLTTSYPIDREKILSKTWKRVSEEMINKLNALDEYFKRDNNFANLRTLLLEKKGQSCIPFLGYYKGNLSYLSYQNYIDKGDLLNIEKIRKTGDFINNFWESLHENKYAIKENDKYNFLQDLHPLGEDELLEVARKLGNFFSKTRTRLYIIEK